jgi:hypothetical protein
MGWRDPSLPDASSHHYDQLEDRDDIERVAFRVEGKALLDYIGKSSAMFRGAFGIVT